MSMPVIDAVVRADRPFVIQGYGKTYELTEDEFNAAMRAADALSDGARLLTTGQAADILGVTAKTVARIIDAGRIPSSRLSATGHRMVEYRDVIRYTRSSASAVTGCLRMRGPWPPAWAPTMQWTLRQRSAADARGAGCQRVLFHVGDRRVAVLRGR